jgi:hypothetical protein
MCSGPGGWGIGPPWERTGASGPAAATRRGCRRCQAFYVRPARGPRLGRCGITCTQRVIQNRSGAPPRPAPARPKPRLQPPLPPPSQTPRRRGRAPPWPRARPPPSRSSGTLSTTPVSPLPSGFRTAFEPLSNRLSCFMLSMVSIYLLSPLCPSRHPRTPLTPNPHPTRHPPCPPTPDPPAEEVHRSGLPQLITREAVRALEVRSQGGPGGQGGPEGGGSAGREGGGEGRGRGPCFLPHPRLRLRLGLRLRLRGALLGAGRHRRGAGCFSLLAAAGGTRKQNAGRLGELSKPSYSHTQNRPKTPKPPNPPGRARRRGGREGAAPLQRQPPRPHARQLGWVGAFGPKVGGGGIWGGGGLWGAGFWAPTPGPFKHDPLLNPHPAALPLMESSLRPIPPRTSTTAP